MIIWLASYPRSGNTFLRILLNAVFGMGSYSLYRDKVPGEAGRVVGHQDLPEGADIGLLSKDQQLRLVKTHELSSDDNKTVYVVRDGRAALSSYYFFHRDVLKVQVTLRELIVGSRGVGSWSGHLAHWHPLERPNTLLLKFEEMTARSESSIEKLSSFLAISPHADQFPRFEELHAMAPDFFRAARYDSWKELFTEEEHELFWQLHGHAMSRYGYQREEV